MTLFNFLKLLNKEKFPFKINYLGYVNVIRVTVDTSSSVEVYDFNEDGVIQRKTLIEESVIEDKHVLGAKIEALENRLERAWLEASKDLNITVITPYKFTSIDGLEYEATGLLPEFGYGQGVLITSRKTDDLVETTAGLSGKYMITGLNPLL